MNDFANARRGLALGISLVAMLAPGCGASSATSGVAGAAATTAGATPTHAHDASDHNHARGKMMLASDGTYNALLTAHLSSRDGNELDVFIEDASGPYALTAKTLEAVARGGNGAKRTVTFACAPAEERPALEAEGTCSHYVARAAWMKPGEVIAVETALPIGGKRVAMRWREFEVRRYAHHEE